MTQSARLLPALLLGVGAWCLLSLTGPSQSFVGTGSLQKPSRTAMQGFKDDFYAWKDSLSKDEQALLLKQAQNEFDKKFRKSDDFSKDLPEEKIQSFAKVLKKFFDNDTRLHFECFFFQQRSTRWQVGLPDFYYILLSSVYMPGLGYPLAPLWLGMEDLEQSDIQSNGSE